MTAADLRELGSLSRKLNEASDTLSHQIAQVETALNELRLGVWAWVRVKSSYTHDELTVNGEPAGVTRIESLGYGKYRGKWCLLFSTSLEEYLDPEYGTTIPLREAPRAERMEAVDKLPALVQALQAKAKETTDRAAGKAVEVGRLAAALRAAAK